MELSELGTIVGILVGILGLTAAFRRWVEGRLETEQKERGVQIGGLNGKIEELRREFHEHQLHVADTYATKKGVSEATDRLMKAIEGVGERLDDRLDSMTQRLDRVIEGRDRS